MGSEVVATPISACLADTADNIHQQIKYATSIIQADDNKPFNE